MKACLVDVAVRVNIWIRPECQKRQWDIIRKARPSVLFLQSDGGRNDNEWQSININRKMIDESIDWNCTVYRLYENKNNGMYVMGQKMAAYIWKCVDSCIFLEDDQIPSVSFFRYCAELLEKYKYDTRIQSICGMNHLGICENVTSDYFFAHQGSIWGTATWKRVYQLRELSLDSLRDDYVYLNLKYHLKDNKKFLKSLDTCLKYGKYDDHIPGGEFWRELNVYSQNMLQIIPKRNMINNIGFDAATSEHFSGLLQTPKPIRELFNMKVYELEFPLIHPKYVFADSMYDKKRDDILGFNRPIRNVYRRFKCRLYKFINLVIKQ